VSVGFLGFLSASAGGSHESESSTGHQSQSLEQTRFHFECEGSYASLTNPLLDSVLKGINNDQWYVPGEDPGYLWSSSGKNGRNVRYYVSEILFTRKLCWYTSDVEQAGYINAANHKSSSAVTFSAGGFYNGFSGGVHGKHAQGSESASQSQKIQSTVKDQTQSHANLAIKFLLLKPLVPGPKRCAATLDDDVESVEYAEAWLKGKTAAAAPAAAAPAAAAPAAASPAGAALH